MRRGDFEQSRVLERLHPVDRAGRDVERRSGGDDLAVRRRIARLADRELDASLLDVDRLVLLPVELQAERVALADEEDLPDVEVGVRPDQLVAPRLVDLARLEGEGLEAFEVP